MAKTAKSAAKSFRAVLEKDHTALGWTIARVPFDPAKVWTKRVRQRVRGEVNGFAFRTSLFPDPRGGYCLLVNRTMQQEAGVALGGTAEFSLEPDMEPRPAELPDELAALMEEEPELLAWYEEMSEYRRREIGRWIAAVKTEEARMRRAQQIAERMLATMEAEREMPPVIARAFRARPKAKAGWERMTAAQRRGQLFAVFYYQTPEAREKRVGKLVEAAERKG